jgi:hypothetical protein
LEDVLCDNFNEWYREYETDCKYESDWIT